MTSRRRFMLYSGAAVLSTGIAVATGSQQKGVAQVSTALTEPSVTGVKPAAVLHMSDFSPLTRDTFILVGEDGQRVKLQLSDVIDRSLDSQLEQFQLRFKGDHHAEMEQGSYIVKHPKLGTFNWLVVPEPTAERGPQYYNVTFNHLLA